MLFNAFLPFVLTACWCGWAKPAPCPTPTVVHCCPPVTYYGHGYAHPYHLVVHPTPPAKEKEKTLYERLGGEAAIKAVVDDFVTRAAANPKVNFTRKGTPVEWKATPENVDHLKKMLVDFVGSATGGPQRYTGRNMKDAHKGMMIKNEEFAALAADLKATLDKLKVPTKEQEELLKAVAATAGDIVETPKKGL